MMTAPDTQKNDDAAPIFSEKDARELVPPLVRIMAAIYDIVGSEAAAIFSRSMGGEHARAMTQVWDEFRVLTEQNPPVRSLIESTRRREKLLSGLAAELGEPEDVVFDRAIAFFRDALAAERRGDRVVITNPEYDVITEMSGFSPAAAPAK